ncbi:MAG: hypothetical protein Q8N23_32995 [Archangium sp.]|nr:hypothetical protein [Archangium sp.]MDP3157533.1 hypothetical protein [Archangium sp.]MDP3574297.1 hypothetical protein [Archangium sp.]
MKTILLSSLLVVTLVGSFGCDTPDDDKSAGNGGPAEKRGNNSDGGSGGGGGGGGPPGGGTEITVFARDLILNETAEHTVPSTTENKGLIDVSPITFTPAFFP